MRCSPMKPRRFMGSEGTIINFLVLSSSPSAGPQEFHDADAGGRRAVGTRPLHHHHHTQDPGADALPQRRTDRRRRRDQRVWGRGIHPSRLSETPRATCLSPGIALPSPGHNPPTVPPSPPSHRAMSCTSSILSSLVLLSSRAPRLSLTHLW